MFNSLQVKDDIFWVGALDYKIRTFDVIMHTDYGTTYNSYIVKGSEKTAMIEAAKDKFYNEHIERVKTVIEPEKIDYLIVDHTEPDHTGAIEMFLDINPDITIVGTVSAIKFLKEITNKDFKNIIVKDGDTLNLGNKTLKFILAPFLHWPDSMYTYLEEDNILFTCDSFGCHYCDDKVFNDQIEGDFLDSYKYYFDCIMGPFKEFVLKALDKIEDLKIDVICPGHGPILRKDIEKYTGFYRQWSENEKTDKVVIGYVSAYGYTKKIAEKISEGVKAAGFEAKLFDLETEDKHNVLREIYTSKGLLLGSPTIVADALPPVWEILIRLNSVVNKGLTAGAFGSYGWSGEAIANIEQRLGQLKFKMPLSGLKILFNPSESQNNEAFEFGKKFAQSIK